MINDIPWDHVFRNFHHFPEGIALRWYQKSQRELRWEQLREDMIARFRGNESDESIWCKITNRKQEDRETFEHFYNSILDLHDRLVNPLSDAQMIGVLRSNVKLETKKCLIPVISTDLNDFVNKCRQTDNLLYPHLYRRYPS